jgi:hypothetical protein
VGGWTATNNGPQYAVARDGRFPIDQPVADATAAPITRLLNWRPPANRWPVGGLVLVRREVATDSANGLGSERTSLRQRRASARGIMTTPMADVWIRKLDSFDDAQRADREFWRSVSPDARVAAVEDLRKQWAVLQGANDEGLRRTVRVLEAPEG